jgi:hypothetical protein
MAMSPEAVETLNPIQIPMTQSLEAAQIPPQTDLASHPGTQSERQEFSLKLCSRTRDRERWYVDGLRGNERLAATLEVALKGQSGVEEAVANPLTGRVLVRYSPDHVQASVEMLIRAALVLDPIMERESSRPVTFRLFRLPARLLAAELGCSLLKLLLLRGASGPVVGGILWAAGVIVALQFLTHPSV